MSGENQTCCSCYGCETPVCFSCGQCKCYCCCKSWNRCKMYMKGTISRFVFIVYMLARALFSIILDIRSDYNILYSDNEDLTSEYMNQASDTLDTIDAMLVTAIVFPFVVFFVLIIEECITLNSKKYGKWKRFSPVIFILLLGSVPQLCLLEAARVLSRQIQPGECPDPDDDDADAVFGSDNAPILLLLEQSLVFLLVLGRWFLPRGKMSREKLSDMLFAFIGMAVDILEFLTEGLGTKQIACSVFHAITVLILTVASLLQFTVDQDIFIGMYFLKKCKRKQEEEYKKEYKKAMRKNKKKKKGGTDQSIIDADYEAPPTKLDKLEKLLQYDEAQTIVLNMFLQELPFFIFRVYMLVKFQEDRDFADTQSLVFFAFKNGGVLLLQVYRLWIILRHVSVSKKKLRKMITNSNLPVFPLDEEILIKNKDGDELILSLERKLEPRSISNQDLQNMVDKYSAKKVLINEDHYLSNSTDKIYLSLREKNEGDGKSTFGGANPNQSIGGIDNEALIVENGQTMVRTVQSNGSENQIVIMLNGNNGE